MAFKTVYELAADLLTAVEGLYMSAGADLPERRFVSDGAAADDCSQLCVELDAMRLGEPTQAGVAAMIDVKVPVATASLAVRVSRCVPTGDDEYAPAPSELDDSAAAILGGDLTLIWHGLVGAITSGDLWPERNAVVLSALPLAQQGGMGGVRVIVSVEVV